MGVLLVRGGHAVIEIHLPRNPWWGTVPSFQSLYRYTQPQTVLFHQNLVQTLKATAAEDERKAKFLTFWPPEKIGEGCSKCLSQFLCHT